MLDDANILGCKTMNMSNLRPGRHGRILSVGGHGAVRRRLLDMGMTPKTEFYVRKVAPFGDPIEIHLRGYALTIRREDADNIVVAEVK